WKFLRNTPDYEFVDWNFGTTTEEDYAWSVNALHQVGHEIYIADFTHLGVYACRILVPGMSEIYPVEELEFENNSVGNRVRPALSRLPDLTDDECADLLDLIDELELADDRLVTVLIGLAPDPESPWTDIRVGEIKLLLALAIGDDEAILEGCTWIAQYGQRSEARLKVYRCIADLVQLADPSQFEPALALLYGRETLQHAFSLFNQDKRFFGLSALGNNFEGSAIHQRLLEAYRKVRG
ncbi:MAG: ribosomal protein S12 methylthiotransferase, partial [Hydrogenophilales bacterium 28-61-11]